MDIERVGSCDAGRKRTMRKPQHGRNKRRGLTLIEVMLVLVILSILAAAVALPLLNASTSAFIKAARSDIKSLETNCELYYTDCRSFPPNLEALIAPPAELSNPNRWKGPYLKQQALPKDPWDHEFMYSYPGRNNQQGPDIWSLGPDGQDGTDDDIGNWMTDT